MVLWLFKCETPEILQIITTMCLFTSLKRKCKITRIMSKLRFNNSLSDKKDRICCVMQKYHANHDVELYIIAGLQRIIGIYPEDFRFSGGRDKNRRTEMSPFFILNGE